MKAKEYLDKYIDKIRACEGNDEELFKLVGNIYMDFQVEAAEIIEKRSIVKLPAAMGVIEEQNKKWNALERRIEQLGIKPVLKKNGFLHAKLRQLEEDEKRRQAIASARKQAE